MLNGNDMKILDYVFYRIYSFYRRNRDDNPIFMGCLVIATSLAFFILSMMTLCQAVLHTDLFLNKAYMLLLGVILIIPIVIRFRNKQRITLLLEKYKQEDLLLKTTKGIFIVIYLILVLMIPIGYGILKHNFNYDI